MSTTNRLSLERFLVGVGAVPMALERYLPTVLRRNFGVRLFMLAVTVIIVAPAIAIVAISDVVVASVFFASVTAVTGFLGYCEMYRALRLINGRVHAVQDGEFDIDFQEARIDEIGETFELLRSLRPSTRPRRPSATPRMHRPRPSKPARPPSTNARKWQH